MKIENDLAILPSHDTHQGKGAGIAKEFGGGPITKGMRAVTNFI